MNDAELAEYDSFVDEMLEHLKGSGEGYDLHLPMREAFGAPWDLRVQVAYLPAPRRSVAAWHEFFLVSLTRDGQPHFAIRCDTPPEVIIIVHNLMAGELDDVPVSPEARLNVPDDSKRYPTWLWGKADALLPDAMEDRSSRPTLRSPW
jgi:hypothetical protein